MENHRLRGRLREFVPLQEWEGNKRTSAQKNRALSLITMGNAQRGGNAGNGEPMNAGGSDEDFMVGRWPGELLGLPESGSGALASVMRRAIGVLIDWVICWIIAAFIVMNTHALGGTGTVTYFLWLVMGIISGWLFARTPGMAVLGMGVARVDKPGEPVGFWRAAVRTILTGFVFPAAIVDADGRGMHDRATGTAVIRS